jgi:hypothetical protein
MMRGLRSRADCGTLPLSTNLISEADVDLIKKAAAFDQFDFWQVFS